METANLTIKIITYYGKTLEFEIQPTENIKILK